MIRVLAQIKRPKDATAHAATTSAPTAFAQRTRKPFAVLIGARFVSH